MEQAAKTNSFSLKKEIALFKRDIRQIPSSMVAVFSICVILMNLLANKELVRLPWLTLDCGTLLSWVSFLCMDVVTRAYGPAASIRCSVYALMTNLAAAVVFWFVSILPGNWGEYYTYGDAAVNAVLNSTIGGTWFVLFGSSVAFIASAIVNSLLNAAIGKMMKSKGFGAFAARSWISTMVGQGVDNILFAFIVSRTLFGWTVGQCIVCSLIQAVFELLFEVVFSPLGYRICRGIEKEGGEDTANGQM